MVLHLEGIKKGQGIKSPFGAFRSSRDIEFEGLSGAGIKSSTADVIVDIDGEGDFDSIEEAIDYISSGTIVIKTGVYSITSKITISKSDVKIKAGGDVVIENNIGSADPGFLVTASENVIFEGLKFEKKSTSARMISGNGCDYLRIIDCQFDDFSDTAIIIDNCDFAFILNNAFITCLTGVDVRSSLNCLVLGNNADTNGGGYLANFSSSSQFCTVANNIGKECSIGFTDSVRGQILGNDLTTGCDDTLILVFRSDNCVVANNNLWNGPSGIIVDLSDNCVVNGNRIDNCTTYGIRVDGGGGTADRNNITGNIALNNGTNFSDAGTNTGNTGNIFA